MYLNHQARLLFCGNLKICLNFLMWCKTLNGYHEILTLRNSPFAAPVSAWHVHCWGSSGWPSQWCLQLNLDYHSLMLLHILVLRWATLIDTHTKWKDTSCNIILIIHVSECISGSATCIEDIYNVANRTRRLCKTLWMSEIMLHCR